jgi:hypothetical protein
MTLNTALRLLAILALLATLLVISVWPGSSILDLNIDVGAKVLALYVAYMVWAAMTLLVGNVFIIQLVSRRPAKA